MTGRGRPAGTTAEGTAEAVRLAAGGDLAAFERLYRESVARVHTLARRLLGPGRADEATQEVYLLAWRKLSSFRGEASFGTWLHRLATNAILDLGRRAWARAGHEEDDGDAAGMAAARAERPELRLDLEAAIEGLPDGARAVFVLHDVEGYDHGEVARALGVSVGTSKSQLHRARMLLRAALGGDASDGDER